MRGTRKLALTEAGETYLAACRRILEALGEAERGAAGEYNAPQGELLITAPVTFGRLHVVPVAAEFLAAHAKVDLRLVLSDRPLNLIDEHLDLALRIGELPDSSLVAVRVGSVRSVVCASPGYLAKRGVPKTPDELATHDCVTFSALGGEGWRFPEGDEIRVHSRMVVSTAEAALDAAMCGVGMTRLLTYQVPAASEGKAAHAAVAQVRTTSRAGEPDLCARTAFERQTARLPGFRGIAAARAPPGRGSVRRAHGI